jgi:hypothetical protein
MFVHTYSRYSFQYAKSGQCHNVAQVLPTLTVRINDDEDVVLSSGFVIPRRTTVAALLGGLHVNLLAYADPYKCAPTVLAQLLACGAHVLPGPESQNDAPLSLLSIAV